MSKIKLYNGDCLSIFPKLPDNSVDLVVIDPPYEQEFHGQILCDPIGDPGSERRNCRNYWVSKKSNNMGLGQRMCIMNDQDEGGACQLSVRVGCFPFR